tara:strand:+ start:2414 stop:2842 length:429 start_codon:yes stop_codon:yes gene_type:complete
MSKKSFNETKIGIFLKKVAPKLLNNVSNVLPDQGALGLLKNLISEAPTVEITPEDKETALKLLEQDIIEMQEITKRWEADSKSGWLAANVRPITLMFFSLAYVVGWYLDYPLDSITGLLSLIVGAYFGSRGIEKVMGNNRHK